jgi:hypothetical protein
MRFCKLSQEALRAGDITQSERDLAWREVDRLLAQIAQGELELLELGSVHRQALLQTAPRE